MTKIINIKEIEGYIQWRRDKEMYPPTWSAQDYIDELTSEQALKEIAVVKDVMTKYSKDMITAEEALSGLRTDLEWEDDIG